MLRCAFFLWLSCFDFFFCWARAQVEPWMDFHGLWLKRRVYRNISAADQIWCADADFDSSLENMKRHNLVKY